MLHFVIAMALAPLQAASVAGELMERLNTPAQSVFETTKKPEDIELCIADALTLIGNPSIFRDGLDRSVFSVAQGGGNGITATVSVIKTQTGNRLETRSRGAWKDRLSARVKSCI